MAADDIDVDIDVDIDIDVDVDIDAMELLFGRPIIENENTSHQYLSTPELLNMGVDACRPDDKPLWWLALRWMKMMFFNIARSYHAKPLLLAVPPLFIGILLGLWIGRWQQQSQSHSRSKKIRHTSKKQQQTQNKRMHQPWTGRLAGFLSVFWYRLVLTFISCIPQNMLTTTCAANVSSTTRENSVSTAKMHVGLVVVGSNNSNISISNRGNQHNNVNVMLGGGDSDDSDNLGTGLSTRENEARSYLKSDEGTQRECDVPVDRVPRHVAVIMDGNRRYGKSKYGNATKGHWDGSSKLVSFAKWCIAEHIKVLTVFAFSSENWKRDPTEVAALMQIFATYCDELRVEAVERNIKIMVLSTDYEKVSRRAELRKNVCWMNMPNMPTKWVFFVSFFLIFR